MSAAEIVALLQHVDGWSGEDWQVYVDEGPELPCWTAGRPWGEAEARAFECCEVEWLNRDPVCSSTNRCLGRGGSAKTNDPLLPYGTEPTAWLHSRCWGTWYANPKAKAVAVLSLILGAG